MSSTKNIVLVLMLILVIGSIYYLEIQKVQIDDVIQDSTSDSKETLGETKDVTNTIVDTTKNSVDRVQEKIPLISPEKKTESKTPRPGPDLKGITGYINAQEGIVLDDFKGKVVLIDFWTYSCINCIRTLPFLTSWDAKYKDKGLVIIGVHTPEFEFEKVTENVEKAMKRHGIEYKVVQDNNYATWKAFKNRFWPHKFLLDKDGVIQYDHIGEGGYEKTEKKIQELLADLGADAGLELTKEEIKLGKKITPELYAGLTFSVPRNQLINDGIKKGEATYSLPSSIANDRLYIDGTWESTADNLILRSDTGSITLSFLAREVNIVADGTIESEILIDGKLHSSGDDVIEGKMKVDEPRLYNVYNAEYGRHTLTINVSGDFSFNSFTFG